MLRHLAKYTVGGRAVCHPYKRINVGLVAMPSKAVVSCTMVPNPLVTQKRWKGAYVSRHNVSMNVSAQIIMDYCQSHGMSKSQFKCTPQHVMIRECPFCPKPTKGKLSNLFKLYVESSTGTYFCHRCGSSGSWYDFKASMNGGSYTANLQSAGSAMTSSSSVTTNGAGTGGRFGGSSSQADVYPGSAGNNSRSSAVMYPQHQHHHVGSSKEPSLPMPQSRLAGLYSSRLLDPNDKNSSAMDYLTQLRGLDRSTLRKYGVGRATYQFPGDRGYVETECITFPWIMKESEIQIQEELRGAEYVPSKPSRKHTDNHSKQKSKDANAVTNKSDSSPSNKSSTTENDNNSTKDSEPTDAISYRDPFVTRRIKARAVTEKSWQRLDPPGGGWGLFGLHTIPDDAMEIVLTEGEYDAMAVSQATGRPAVSLPNGCRSLPVPVLPLLERFSKIYLWMDNDAPGQEGAEKFAKKLGLNRCFIVSCRDAKDANDALLKGLDLDQYIQQASVVPHDRLLTFADLRADVLHELLEPELYKGSPIPSLPGFTNMIKGFRRGEMTVLTGATGSGKTTFLGQISLDLAEQGVNVLWGSFEIKNSRLLHKLLKQHSREALPDSKDPDALKILNALADRFECLPMHFLRFHGGSDIDEVLDAMEYAVYVNDTEHIILDNMQFMLTRSNKASGTSFEKFDVQDVAIEKFRKFATQHNVHLTLVVHPRKEDEAAPLNISSFYGSAKATQEADTVLILQTDPQRGKTIDVKKNRFDGTLGKTRIFFESKSGRYTEEEGGGGTAFSDGGRPRPITFATPRQAWRAAPKEPEPEGLDQHFDSMLTPSGKYDE